MIFKTFETPILNENKTTLRARPVTWTLVKWAIELLSINAAIKVILGILSLRDFKISSLPNVRHVLGSLMIE